VPSDQSTESAFVRLIGFEVLVPNLLLYCRLNQIEVLIKAIFSLLLETIFCESIFQHVVLLVIMKNFRLIQLLLRMEYLKQRAAIVLKPNR
jgi:hypothetical protein